MIEDIRLGGAMSKTIVEFKDIVKTYGSGDALLYAALPPVLLPAVLLRRQIPQPPTIGYTLMHRKTWKYIWTVTMWESHPVASKRHREVT